MRVTFRKTNQRRYGVHVQRDAAPALWMYGPGYDDDLPHDLLHFVVEAEFGLDGAVFGDVAAGGNAKLFQPVDKALVATMWRKKRMHRYVLPEGMRSERLAGVLKTAWKARRSGRPLPAEWDDRLGARGGGAAGGEWNDRRAAAGVGAAEVEALLPKLDALAETWRTLPPGGELTLEWPRSEG